MQPKIEWSALATCKLLDFGPNSHNFNDYYATLLCLEGCYLITTPITNIMCSFVCFLWLTHARTESQGVQDGAI